MLCRHLPYWELMTEQERISILGSASVRSFRAGALIHNGRDDCFGQAFVLSGALRAYLLSEDGKEATLFMLREGDTCVLSSSCMLSQITFDTFIDTTEETRLLIIPLGTFRQIVEQNDQVKLAVYELALGRFSMVVQNMQQILFLGFDRRLAAFLTAEYDRTGNPVVRMTHEQIAAQVSSAREVVARMLKRFAAQGLVETERGIIRLTDIPGLRQML